MQKPKEERIASEHYFSMGQGRGIEIPQKSLRPIVFKLRNEMSGYRMKNIMKTEQHEIYLIEGGVVVLHKHLHQQYKQVYGVSIYTERESDLKRLTKLINLLLNTNENKKTQTHTTKN